MKITKIFKRHKKPNYINFLMQIKDSGYQLKTVYDIGAFKGEWSATLKKLSQCRNYSI